MSITTVVHLLLAQIARHSLRLQYVSSQHVTLDCLVPGVDKEPCVVCRMVALCASTDYQHVSVVLVGMR